MGIILNIIWQKSNEFEIFRKLGAFIISLKITKISKHF